MPLMLLIIIIAIAIACSSTRTTHTYTALHLFTYLLWKLHNVIEPTWRQNTRPNRMRVPSHWCIFSNVPNFLPRSCVAVLLYADFWCLNHGSSQRTTPIDNDDIISFVEFHFNSCDRFQSFAFYWQQGCASVLPQVLSPSNAGPLRCAI